MFVGFHIAFFPMHISGLLGMPRRIYTYAANMGWNGVNMISTLGSFLFATGVLLFLINLVISIKRGAPSGANPWDAPTLEWAVPSPPPPYNFAVIPVIGSRHPLWEDRLNETPERSSIQEGYLLMDGRETLGTSAIDAVPSAILRMPGDAYSPFYLGLFVSLCFVGLLVQSTSLVVCALIGVAGAMTAWMWPRRKLGQRIPVWPGEGSL